MARGIAAIELMPDFSGQVLAKGRFLVLDCLGSGAYGKVYRALDTTSPEGDPTYYAIKCLDRHVPGSHLDFLQQREFALHKLVSGHPNIVTFHACFRDDLYVYVVLDLCTGGDLFTAITEQGLFHNNSALIKTAFLQLLDAVEHIHDLGVFHRDIKPENVLFSKDSSLIRLADFGLSIRSPVCEEFGCGSSYYMSPECIGRDSETRYSTRHNDIWALGVILTNMITGRNPWRYATADDDCYAAFLKDNDFPRQVLPISEGVNRILKRIFTENPLRRIILPDLRQKVLELDSMFIQEKQFAARSHFDAQHEKLFATKTAPATCGLHVARMRKNLSSDGSILSLDSDEIYMFASPTDEHPPVTSSEAVHISDVPRFTNSNDSSVCESDASSPSLSTSSKPGSGHSDSSGSDGDSKGPITPATFATDVEIEVPDLTEDEGLGQPAVVPFSAVEKVKSTSLIRKRLSRSTHLFKVAYQRIIGNN